MYAESSLNAYRPHPTQEDTRRVTVKYNSAPTGKGKEELLTEEIQLWTS